MDLSQVEEVAVWEVRWMDDVVIVIVIVIERFRTAAASQIIRYVSDDLYYVSSRRILKGNTMVTEVQVT